MTRATALSLHELSYLCGGPRRAVLTAVLALCQSNQLEIGTDRRAYRLDEAPTEPSTGPAWSADLDSVEQAVLDVVPAGGADLATIISAVADSAGMRQARSMLAARGLAPKWLPGLTRAGRRARREVLANPPDGLRRIAVLGPDAVQNAQLREALTAMPTTSRSARQAVHHTPVRRGAASSA